MSTVPETAAIARLLAEAGMHDAFACQNLAGGGNNRVFRIDCQGQSVLLKAYFQHPQDPRDRLHAEFSFCRFAWDAGLRCLPFPLVCDRASALGLYEFIEGRPLSPGEIGHGEVDQALDFFCALNRHKSSVAARELASGSEACFTLEEHLACVERRVMSLTAADLKAEEHAEAAAFVHQQLAPTWQQVKSRILAEAASQGLPLDRPLPEQDRCLSPSDFGFHNAILPSDGRLRFLDFEYSGWDDPAKMTCDFFCQPAVPVRPIYFEPFVRRVTAGLSDPPSHARRIELLLPVYRIKWCCIMLNEFLPAGRQRRSFARDERDETDRRKRQLEKARGWLAVILDSGAP